MNRPPIHHGAALAVAIVLGIEALGLATADADDSPGDLDLLVEWMTGTFSSAAQAAEDPDFFDISLHMAPIWVTRTDGLWLYVEQAVTEHQDRPYRQRVYRVLELAPGLFEILVYTLPNPNAVIGAWLSNEPFPDLEPADLEERQGCAILLRRSGEAFIGSTLASLCASTLRGASYASSEVMITPDGMISWDRGFADDGGQVWGATTGGYVFDRIVADDSASESETESVSETESGPESDPESDPE